MLLAGGVAAFGFLWHKRRRQQNNLYQTQSGTVEDLPVFGQRFDWLELASECAAV